MIVTRKYYEEVFGGSLIPSDEFDVLSRSAEEILRGICTVSPDDGDDDFKKAVIYQAELLFSQGGTDAVAGIAIGVAGVTEKLGDYSVGGNIYSTGETRLKTFGGIPVSAIALSLVRRAGYTSRVASEIG